MTFVAYQLINFIAFWLNVIERILPTLNRISRTPSSITYTVVWTSLTSMFVITVAVLAKAQPKQSVHFVFTDFENTSGWGNNVIAFITGFINANYSFSCLDAATHLAEEIPHPERNIPKALLAIPVIGILSSLFYNISMVHKPLSHLIDFRFSRLWIMIRWYLHQLEIQRWNYTTKP
jgi:choline transport protein